MTITPDNTKIRFIAQNLSNITKDWWKTGIGYGYGIDTPSVLRFIESSFPFSTPITPPTSSEHSQKVQFVRSLPTSRGGRTLILTTSMRHVRELGALFDAPVLMQGTSGGKAKMRHYYAENPESILIGLIDTWRDVADIFTKTDSVIIAKIPFDPPTDPYFLAKTRGMSHNFENYSKPIVLSKLNTLIGTIMTAHPQANIYCTDERIFTTQWGQFLQEHLL